MNSKSFLIIAAAFFLLFSFIAPLQGEEPENEGYPQYQEEKLDSWRNKTWRKLWTRKVRRNRSWIRDDEEEGEAQEEAEGAAYDFDENWIDGVRDEVMTKLDSYVRKLELLLQSLEGGAKDEKTAIKELTRLNIDYKFYMFSDIEYPDGREKEVLDFISDFDYYGEMKELDRDFDTLFNAILDIIYPLTES